MINLIATSGNESWLLGNIILNGLNFIVDVITNEFVGFDIAFKCLGPHWFYTNLIKLDCWVEIT